jgi:glucosylceramidase
MKKFQNSSYAASWRLIIAALFFWMGNSTAAPTDTIKASTFSGQSGVTTETCSEGGQNVTSIEADDHIFFSNMDFGAGGIQCFEARVASYGNGGFIELHLDSPTGTLIGTCEILPPTGGWQTWTNKACQIKGATGTHTLYLVFKGGVGSYKVTKLFNLNWFKFHGTPALTTTNWRQSTSSQKGILKAPITLTAASGTPEIEIFPDSMYQRIDGWGGAFNENGYCCITALSRSMRAAVMRDLYDQVTGCRFNIGRIPMGMNDFTVNKVYSLNETPGDYAMTNFSLKNDSLMNMAFVKEAMAVNPNIMLHAAPWTPPSWMKTNNNWEGTGYPSINQNAQTWTAYALYFSKFLKGWQKAGFSINIIYPQNEPGWCSANHPSCNWSGTSLKNFVRDYLFPKFSADSIATQIWMGTFHMSSFGGDIAPTLNDPVARTMITGVGTQRDGNIAMGEASQNSFYRSLHYHGMQTETHCWWGANSWSDAMNTFQQFHNHLTGNTQCYTMWNMILDSDYNFVDWMTRSQNSMITITPATQKIKYNHEFYVVKHWSHYIRIGAVRLHSPKTACCAPWFLKIPTGQLSLRCRTGPAVR